MKIRFCAALLIALLMVPLLTGCSLWTLEERLDAIEDKLEAPIDAAEDAVENAAEKALGPAPTAAPDTLRIPAESGVNTQMPAAELTPEEAETIALEHAGLTADQLLYLHTELDYDDGRQEYDIEFQVDRWEYDYEIHAQTGAILSWDKDWDD